MSIRLIPLALLVGTLIFGLHADYTELIFKDCGSRGTVIKRTALTPMPVLNPGKAYLTFVATLLRRVGVLETKLDIIRKVSGISLPVRCYLVNGNNVGSCTYPSLCQLLQDLLPEFRPETCSPTLTPFGIDCRCPFKIPPQELNLIDEELNLPDASQTAASFLAVGDFNITVVARDTDNLSAPQPYGCGNILFTVKQAKPGR